VVISENLRFF